MKDSRVPAPIDVQLPASIPIQRHSFHDAKRAADWQEILSDVLVPITLNARAGRRSEHFQMNVRFQRIAVLSFAAFSPGGLIAISHRRKVDQRDSKYLKVLFMIAGLSLLSQGAREVALKAGTWTLYDPTTPYRIDSDDGAECLALALPVRDVWPWQRFVEHETTAVQPIRGNALLAMQSMRLCLDGGIDPGLDDLSSFGESIALLMGSAVSRAIEPLLPIAANKTSHILLLRAQEQVRNHYHDPELTVDSLAQALQVSRRTLYNALQAAEQTPQRLILRYRLDAFRRALANPALSHKTLTELGLDVGFSDIAHFSRLFRKHFGLTPRVYREMHRNSK
ncbi:MULTISPECIES: AraC family transcriptional regulator [Pseudomonas]|nr:MULTISPECIES: AraC family transcriptional regulator [Pseudomonas]